MAVWKVKSCGRSALAGPNTRLPPLATSRAGARAHIQTPADLLWSARATRFQPGRKEDVMAKGQMRSNKEKKKPKADRNIKKGGATPSPFSSGKTPTVQSLNSKKWSASSWPDLLHGHPRLEEWKTWMRGIRPAMTSFATES
jgi:hypothetical protein